MQYSFDRREHAIEIKLHGNSKGNMPFNRCKPSTVKKLKLSAQVKTPTQALQDIENSMGGVMGARSSCDLPRCTTLSLPKKGILKILWLERHLLFLVQMSSLK